MSYAKGIIVVKYALSSGPFLVVPGQQFGKHECNALVEIYEDSAPLANPEKPLALQGLDQLPTRCCVKVDPQLNGFYSSYFYNTEGKVEFVLNNPQGQDLAYKVIDNLEIEENKKFHAKLTYVSQARFDSVQPFHLKKAKAARDFITNLEVSNG